MPATLKLLCPLVWLFLAAQAVQGAGFPIRRADSSWGEYTAGLVDGGAFIAAGKAHGSHTGTKVSFIGKWDLDGNPIWEKSTRGWADDYRSIRKNPDGSYLLLMSGSRDALGRIPPRSLVAYPKKGIRNAPFFSK